VTSDVVCFLASLGTLSAECEKYLGTQYEVGTQCEANTKCEENNISEVSTRCEVIITGSEVGTLRSEFSMK